MEKRIMKVSDKTSIDMPIRNLLSIVAAVAVGVWAYFGVVSRITSIETSLVLAEKDLEIRGAGNVFGIKQSGIPDSITKSLTNPFLVEKTRDWAKRIIQHSPDLKKYPLLKERVQHMEKTTHLE